MIRAMREYIKCNQCNSDETKDFFSIYSGTFGESQEYWVVRCKKCGLAYLNPRPAEQKILDMYKNRYYDLINRPDISGNGKVHFSQSHLTWQKFLLDRIERYALKGRICDIGCGYGSFLDLARTQGWETCGIELSHQFAGYSRDVLGVNLFEGTLRECSFSSSFFDAINSNNVIEHYVDPYHELLEINRVLKSNGILQILTPNLNGLTARASRFYLKLKGKRGTEEDGLLQHLYSFSTDTLIKMLKKAGFEIVEVSTRVTNKRRSLQIRTGWKKLGYQMLLWLADKSNEWGDMIIIVAKKASFSTPSSVVFK